MTTPPLNPIATHLDRLSVGPYGTPDIDGTILQLTAIDGALLLPNMTAVQATEAFTWGAVDAVVGPPAIPAISANLNGNSDSIPGMMICITSVAGAPAGSPFLRVGAYVFDQSFITDPPATPYNGAWKVVGGGGGGGGGVSLPGPGVIVTDSSGNPSAVSNLVASETSSFSRLGSGPGTGNLSLGVGAYPVTATGNENIAFGDDVLANVTDGSYNVGISLGALGVLTEGNRNIGIGVGSQGGNIDGQQNTSVGYSTLVGVVHGTGNSAFGASAASSSEMNYCTLLGAGAGTSTDGLIYSTALGAEATVSAPNTMVLGGTGDFAVSVAVGATSADPSAVLGLYSTTQGFQPPAMTTAERTGALQALPPSDGLQVYDTDTKVPYYWNASIPAWVEMSAGTPLVLPGPGVIVTDSGGTPSAVSALIDDADNLFLGLSGPASVPSGASANTGIGDFVLPNITSSAQANTATGFGALQYTTTGGINSAFGAYALNANTTGQINSAFGAYALNANTTGGSNSAFGVYALTANTTGQLNAAFGSYALNANTTGDSNTAIGRNALRGNTIGYGNTAVGENAEIENTSLNYCTFFGSQALALSDNLNYASCIGSVSAVSTSNTMVLGGPTNSPSKVSVVIGATGSTPDSVLSLISTTQGFLPPAMTTANRTGALQALPPSDGLQVYDTDTKVPYYWNASIPAWVEMSAGTPLVLPGPGVIVTDSLGNPSAVSALIDDADNLFLGLSGPAYVPGGASANTGIGDFVLPNITSSAQANTATGFGALQYTTTGGINSAFGAYALNANTTGGSNTAVGWSSLQGNTIGGANTAVGSGAGTSGNTGVDSSLNRCTFLGAATAGIVDNLNYAVCIGADSYVSTNNTMVLGGANDSSGKVSVVIGATGSTSDSVLSLISTTQGFLPPAMSTSEKLAIASPSDGLQVYDNTLDEPFYWNASIPAWVSMTGGGSATVTNGSDGPLVAGTLTISSSAVTSSSSIMLTNTSFAGVPGILSVSAKTAGTGFTVTSSSNTDTSSFAWVIVN